MEIATLSLKGPRLIKPKIFQDNRGFFLESFSPAIEKEIGSFIQDNHSFSKKGTIRGMHFQSSPGQAKLVRVASGKILDVVVDIRKESPTFGKWEGVVLDGENHEQLFVPIGFAHGFCVLSDEAHVLYKVSSPYNPETEKGFRFDDPDVGIEWPATEPILSERDKTTPYLKEIML